MNLEERAVRDRCVYVPVSVEYAEELAAREEGPVYVHLEPHPSEPLLREMIIRREM